MCMYKQSKSSEQSRTTPEFLIAATLIFIVIGTLINVWLVGF